MLFGVISDIHGRRSAMLRALALARESGVERLVFLGDYVGYMGSDPIGVVETAMYLEGEGATRPWSRWPATARPPSSR